MIIKKKWYLITLPFRKLHIKRKSERMEGSSNDDLSNSNLDQPPTKRPRLDHDATAAAADNNNNNEEKKLAELLVDGDDDFITEEERQKAEAERRRQQRRLRLQQLEAKKEKEEMIVETAPETTSTTPGVEDADKMDTKSDIEEQQSQQSNDDDDEFDMFSSSVSPIQVSDNKKGASTGASDTKRGHEQTDWDDVEGYYKAVIGEMITMKISTADDSREGIISLRVAGVIGKG